IIDEDLLNELDKIIDYDPDHLPAEIEMVRLFKKHFPSLMQVACFDTAFHTTIPLAAKTFAIPKKYYDEGVQRYGFHGISYSYLMQELRKQNEAEANGKIILAHLGNGASLAAVIDGKCIDTSMGFTPTGGIPMSTRSGDLDPGVAWYLMHKGIDARQFNDLINHQSGLLGISGISSDMQDLLRLEKENKNATLAIDIFCYQVKKYIGGYAAVLGGLDILVFSGGIGENAPAIRERICKDLGYLNIHLNGEKNNKNQWQISKDENNVKVYVIPTNEELMIAKTTGEIYEKSIKDKNEK
ncbi:MAG: acetate/propionate family kinase, partial [Aquaticitalea sp.]